ncbi:hypothetical protein D3C75_1015500 [compost metagenome]
MLPPPMPKAAYPASRMESTPADESSMPMTRRRLSGPRPRPTRAASAYSQGWGLGANSPSVPAWPLRMACPAVMTASYSSSGSPSLSVRKAESTSGQAFSYRPEVTRPMRMPRLFSSKRNSFKPGAGVNAPSLPRPFRISFISYSVTAK